MRGNALSSVASPGLFSTTAFDTFGTERIPKARRDVEWIRRAAATTGQSIGTMMAGRKFSGTIGLLGDSNIAYPMRIKITVAAQRPPINMAIHHAHLARRSNPQEIAPVIRLHAMNLKGDGCTSSPGMFLRTIAVTDAPIGNSSKKHTALLTDVGRSSLDEEWSTNALREPLELIVKPQRADAGVYCRA
jgi:hypothetical protein